MPIPPELLTLATGCLFATPAKTSHETWRGPQLYSPTSQLVSDERSQNNAGRTDQEEMLYKPSPTKEVRLAASSYARFIFLSGKLQDPSLHGILWVEEGFLPKAFSGTSSGGTSFRHKEATWRSVSKDAFPVGPRASRVSLASSELPWGCPV